MTNNDSTRALVASILKQNIDALTTAMRGAGLDRIQVDYQGSGDSGEEHEHEYEVPDCQVPFRSIKRSYNREAHAWEDKDETEDVDFDTAAELILEELIRYQGNAGFENNEGGGGTLRMSSDGTFEYEHYWYETKTSYEPMYTGEDLVAQAAIADAASEG